MNCNRIYRMYKNQRRCTERFSKTALTYEIGRNKMYKNYLKEPVWKDDKDGVTLTFYGPRALAAKKALRENGGVSDGVKAVANAIDDGLSKGVMDGVSDGVKAELIKIVEVLDAQEGLNAQEVAEAIGKSKPTVERYLRIARKLGIIEFKGAPRTGGYYLVKPTSEESADNF